MAKVELRNCPKSLGRARRITLRAAEKLLLGPFSAGFSVVDPYRVMRTEIDGSAEKLLSRSCMLAHAGQYHRNPLYEIPALVHLQERFWVMSCSAAYELAERNMRSFVNAHKAALSIAQ